MSSKIKLFFILLPLFSSFVFPTKALAVHECGHLEDTVTLGSTDKVIQLWHLECIFANVIGTLAALAGITALLVIIYGGIKYTTAQGDPKALDSARKTITLAVAGLVMVLLSYFIIDALQRFTSSTPSFRQFRIPKP